jgi:acetylornithine/succinyldiaminopimelate/putrescine aminotransferase
MSKVFGSLDRLGKCTGEAHTKGLSVARLQQFIDREDLQVAVDSALVRYESLSDIEKEMLKTPEKELLVSLQSGFLNFYSLDSISSYVPLAAKGPWIVTAYGAVVYDTGGYGMLGHGHNPSFVSELLSREQVMANIMTASFEQARFSGRLRQEIGRRRSGGCPFAKFICMNSGSEAMSVATRISDLHAGSLTASGQPKEGAVMKIAALKGAFHGRTGRPARVSGSSFKAYRSLASFRDYDGTLFIEPNNIEDLERVFGEAEANNHFVEFFALEPVMGEGDPGLAITPEFYQRARELTKKHKCVLIVDSIQAGLRTTGNLSIVDYPGFEDLEAPDIESYSKAINAGQFPVSVLAISEWLSAIYQPGVYGNTMTANPRALELTRAVLDLVDDRLRENIRQKGLEFISGLKRLQKEFPKKILKVQGTGLLVSAELSPELKTVGKGSVEDNMRREGVNVIHGGVNSLRFTPWFHIDSKELELILDVLRTELGK